MPKPNWYQLEAAEVFEKLNTSLTGLSPSEVENRRQKFGPNELPKEKPPTWLYFFFSQFNDVFVFILAAAAAISIALENQIDFYVILAVIFTDVVLGFIQEYRASRELVKLRQITSLKAVTRRANNKQQLNSEELVPGDIIYLQQGDKVPADARLIRATDLKTDEAILTGESHPVTKQAPAITTKKTVSDQSNMLFSGTTVVSGSAKAIVVATGRNSEFGKISGLIQKARQEKTPLQKRIAGFAKFIGIITAIMVLIIVLTGGLLGLPLLEIFILAVALAVAAIPEGVVIGVTTVLAIGMSRILKKNALARKLVAAETLGSTTLIGMDKTGTLTEGKMRLTEIITQHKEYNFDELSKEQVQKSHALQNIFIGSVVGSESFVVNPEAKPEDLKAEGLLTENALVIAAAKMGYFENALARRFEKVKTIPFDSKRKYSLSQNNTSKGRVVFLKGAPEVIIKMADLIETDTGNEDHQKEKKFLPAEKDRLLDQVEKLTAQGFRLLAFAHAPYQPAIKNLSQAEKLIAANKIRLAFDGLVILKDPIRKSVKESLDLARRAGLRVVIITGDHPNTVRTIARKLDIKVDADKILLGRDIENLTDRQLEKTVAKTNVFARVSPSDKLRLIDAWQHQDEVVAMTGDGVNDAPAIKSADIGIAVGAAADVTKESADLVLLDNNFKTIVAAIQEGRGIYANIKKIILYLISDSFSEAIVVLGALFAGLPLPILAVQILWNNLIAHGFPDLALTADPFDKENMNEPPRDPKEPIMTRKMIILTVIISAVHGLSVLVLFFLVLRATDDLTLARTIAFASLGVDSLLYVFSIRDLRRSIFRAKFLSNVYLIFSVIFGVALQAISIYLPFFQHLLRTTPLRFEHWGLVAIMAVTVLISIEITKAIFNWRDQPRPKTSPRIAK